MKKTFLCLMLAFAVLLCACGSASEAKFEKSDFSVTLTTDFEEYQSDGCHACYKDKNVTVYVFKNDFSSMAGLDELDAELYAATIASLNSSASDLQEKDGLLYYDYPSRGSDGTEYKNISFTFKGSEAFYQLQFSVSAKKYEKLKNTIFSYAETFVCK